MWFQQAWDLFKKDAGVWILLGVIYTVLAGLISSIPGFGTLAAFLLEPLLGAGFLLAVDQAHHDKPVLLSDLWRGFKHERAGTLVANAFLVLLAYGGVILAAVLFGFVAFAADYERCLALFKDPSLFQLSEHWGLFLRAAVTLLFAAMLAACVGMASFFAPQSILFKGEEAWPALKHSFLLFNRHLGALFIYAIATLLWGMLSVLPLGLGLLIFIPVALISKYYAFREMA